MSYVTRPSSIIILTALCWLIFADSAVPSSGLLSYQGRLTEADGNPVGNGLHAVEFAIYADSVGGTPLWSENTTISTLYGMFTHLLGSEILIPSDLFTDTTPLYLQVTFEGEAIMPRSIITGAPSAAVAGKLSVIDSNDSLVIGTDAAQRRLSLYDQTGREQVAITGTGAGGQLMLGNPDGGIGLTLDGGLHGDSSVVLPDSSINSKEILNETGYVTWINTSPVTLVTLVMTDLINLEIEIPADGYIVLQGKCYVELSGTTGPNIALIQIDENEGGGSQFPYYTLAGLGGYVNTNSSYFPVYVTRVYHKQAGIHYFRMEGRANNAAPALARSWDHVLTATYYPTSYGVVSKVSRSPEGNPTAVPVDVSNRPGAESSYRLYRMDMRYFEVTPERDKDKSEK